MTWNWSHNSLLSNTSCREVELASTRQRKGKPLAQKIKRKANVFQLFPNVQRFGFCLWLHQPIQNLFIVLLWFSVPVQWRDGGGVLGGAQVWCQRGSLLPPHNSQGRFLGYLLKYKVELRHSITLMRQETVSACALRHSWDKKRHSWDKKLFLLTHHRFHKLQPVCSRYIPHC